MIRNGFPILWNCCTPIISHDAIDSFTECFFLEITVTSQLMQIKDNTREGFLYQTHYTITKNINRVFPYLIIINKQRLTNSRVYSEYTQHRQPIMWYQNVWRWRNICGSWSFFHEKIFFDVVFFIIDLFWILTVYLTPWTYLDR